MKKDKFVYIYPIDINDIYHIHNKLQKKYAKNGFFILLITTVNYGNK